MKLKNIFMLVILLIIGTSFAQVKYAVLPTHSMGVDDVTTQTVNMLLKQEIVKETGAELISESQISDVAGDDFMDRDCAVEIGKKLEADKVVSTSMSKLGNKIVVQFMLFDVQNNSTILSDNVISKNADDLEMVIVRISKSIAQEIPIEKSAEVGAIVKGEEKSLQRRRAKRFSGLSFGYLFPIEEYDNKDKIIAFDFRYGFEMSNTAVGLMLGIRYGFSTNVYIHYLMSRKDICPYVGGALGFHWIAHEDMFTENSKRTDGFELTGSAGLRLFRTYNFQVVLNLDYIYTMNDFDDQALVLTIGLLK